MVNTVRVYHRHAYKNVESCWYLSINEGIEWY